MRKLQGHFTRKGNPTYVVVRPIRLTPLHTLEPGTTVKLGDFPAFRIRYWFKRRRIGFAGTPWVAAMLANPDKPYFRPERHPMGAPDNVEIDAPASSDGEGFALPDALELDYVIEGSAIDFIAAVARLNDYDSKTWLAATHAEQVDAVDAAVNTWINVSVAEMVADLRRDDNVWVCDTVDATFRTKKSAGKSLRNDYSYGFVVGDGQTVRAAPIVQAE